MKAKIKTNRGNIKLNLFHQEAKLTVSNFVNLSKRGFYNNLTFHRVIDDFMIQGGCPIGTGTGDPGYKFKDEFHKDLKHDQPGMLSMANSGPNTNGSQFFITYDDLPHLDGLHTVFGKVILGMEILEELPARNPINAHESGLVIEKVILSDFPRMGPFP